MNRKGAIIFFIFIYLLLGLFLISSINGFLGAKWFDSGMDLVYGAVIIYLAVTLYYSSKLIKNKNIFYVIAGFVIILFERIFQIFLQEINLKTNYQLAIISWGWILVDVVMVTGLLFIVRGLWGVKND